jgi:hypothetical protein
MYAYVVWSLVVSSSFTPVTSYLELIPCSTHAQPQPISPHSHRNAHRMHNRFHLIHTAMHTACTIDFTSFTPQCTPHLQSFLPHSHRNANRMHNQFHLIHTACTPPAHPVLGGMFNKWPLSCSPHFLGACAGTLHPTSFTPLHTTHTMPSSPDGTLDEGPLSFSPLPLGSCSCCLKWKEAPSTAHFQRRRRKKTDAPQVERGARKSSSRHK